MDHFTIHSWIIKYLASFLRCVVDSQEKENYSLAILYRIAVRYRHHSRHFLSWIICGWVLLPNRNLLKPISGWMVRSGIRMHFAAASRRKCRTTTSVDLGGC
jgi:hypothetical protein